eukprot:EG_transcript_14699
MSKFLRLTTKANPIARSSHGLSAHQDTVYLFGGEHVARKPIDGAVYALKVDAAKLDGPHPWSVELVSSGSRPSARVAHAQCVTTMNGQATLFVFGGRQGVNIDEKPLGDMHTFNLETKAWSEVQAANPEAAPAPRSYHRMVTDGKMLYVFGGCSAAGRQADLHAFDTETLRWDSLPAAPCPGRGGAGFFATPGRLYVVAGFMGRETNDVHVYDIATKAWTTLAKDGELESFRPRSVFAHGAASDGAVDKLYLIGGEVSPSDKGHEGAGGFLSQVTVLTVKRNDNSITVEDVVKDGSAMGFVPRGWTEAAVLGEHLAVFGGLTGDDASPERLGDTWLVKL